MIIQDPEFGKITVRRSPRATQIRVRISPDGNLRASLPLYTPMFLLKRMIKSSRTELREMLSKAQVSKEQYYDGMKIGKSHSLYVDTSRNTKLKVSRHGQKIVINLPSEKNLHDPDVTREIRDGVISALRVEAKSYLPKRLAFLSSKLGLDYENVRFSHASGRWGSCSSKGTISLNIALMKLPFELIDYVIIHELSHTRFMNHSSDFWQLVSIADPDYKSHRRTLKSENPSI